MTHNPIQFSDHEKALLRKHKLAVFAGRIIFDAQPPITPQQIEEIEGYIDGQIPEDLLNLWSVSFGGQLDYDMTVSYDSMEHSFSFVELFYPDSRGYHTLIGWIEHEREIVEDIAADRETEWNGKLDVLPIGGFEYLERIYVVTSPEAEAGQVEAWSHGLPPAWVGRLNEDSAATIAASLSEAFQLLRYHVDPFDNDERFPSGEELLEAIEPLKEDGVEGAALAEKLYALMRAAFTSWQEKLDIGTLKDDRPLSQKAIEAALKNDDAELLQRLEKAGLDMDSRRRGGLNALDLSAQMEAEACFDWLLKQGVSNDETFKFATASLTKAQATALLEKGAPLSVKNMSHAADRFSHVDAFEFLCEALLKQRPNLHKDLVAMLKSKGEAELDYAQKLRAGTAGSYRSAEETEAQGRALLDLSKRFDRPSN